MKSITLGILGGGQLGRMSAMAAARLGIKVIIYTDEKNSPASQVSAETIVAKYDDKKSLQIFSKKVDVISYEFENIPVETIKFIKKLKPVYPDERLLEVSQDRLKEKAFLNSIGIATARWGKANNPHDALRLLKEWNQTRCIIKTTRLGYDGKGQAFCKNPASLDAAFRKLKPAPLTVEEVINFKCEISVIIARDANGTMETYGPMLNQHKNHILDRTIVPAGMPDALSNEAITMAKKLAKAVNLRGVLTLELFVTKDGPKGQRILANEIAPRTHNSGHWTIDACAASQFEQHVRAVCGLPIASSTRHSDAIMINLIGDDILKTASYLKKPNACVHIYGKTDVKPGRKMGHITLLKPLSS